MAGGGGLWPLYAAFFGAPQAGAAGRPAPHRPKAALRKAEPVVRCGVEVADAAFPGGGNGVGRLLFRHLPVQVANGCCAEAEHRQGNAGTGDGAGFCLHSQSFSCFLASVVACSVPSANRYTLAAVPEETLSRSLSDAPASAVSAVVIHSW